MGEYHIHYTGEQIEAAIGALLEGRAIVITNCPNCGAPAKGRQCEFCGTVFVRGDDGEKS